LKYRSKVKHGYISGFLEYDILTLATLFFALKPKEKKLFSIEIVLFNTFTISEAYRKKISHRKLPRTNLRKELIEIMKLLFVHIWNLPFWREDFLHVYDLKMKVKVKFLT
jgi:hypothetical protein